MQSTANSCNMKILSCTLFRAEGRCLFWADYIIIPVLSCVLNWAIQEADLGLSTAVNICCIFTGNYFRFYWVASMCLTLKESLLKGLVHILQVIVHQKMCHTLILTLTCFCQPEMFICMASKHGSISNQLQHSKFFNFIFNFVSYLSDS